MRLAGKQSTIGLTSKVCGVSRSDVKAAEGIPAMRMQNFVKQNFVAQLWFRHLKGSSHVKAVFFRFVWDFYLANYKNMQLWNCYHTFITILRVYSKNFRPQSSLLFSYLWRRIKLPHFWHDLGNWRILSKTENSNGLLMCKVMVIAGTGIITKYFICNIKYFYPTLTLKRVAFVTGSAVKSVVKIEK